MIKYNLIAAPSILAADFTNINEAIALTEKAGAEWLHLDVMDGAFVPPITFGAQMVKDIRKKTDLVLDVHLMIERPEDKVMDFIDAGADFIVFHLEATTHVHRLIQLIKEKGVKAGIAIVPSTPVSALKEILPDLDQVLIMSVNPGYGGQKLIPNCLNKIKELDSIRKENNYDFKLSIDGGVNLSTIDSVRASGVDAFVAGSAFFGSKNPVEDLSTLKNG